MGRRGLAGTGGSDDQDQPVGLVELLDEQGQGIRRHPQFVQGHDLSPGQDPQDHVLHVAVGRHGGHPSSMSSPLGRVYRIFPSWGRAPLRDIQVGENLDARDNRRAVVVGQRAVRKALAVDAEPDDYLPVPDVRLDMDVRGASQAGLVDDLVHQADDGSVRLGDVHEFVPPISVLSRIFLCSGGFLQVGRSVEMIYEIQNVFPGCQAVLDLFRLQQVFDAVPPRQVVRVVHQDRDPSFPPLQGYPSLAVQVFVFEVYKKAAGDGNPFVEGYRTDMGGFLRPVGPPRLTLCFVSVLPNNRMSHDFNALAGCVP